MPKRKTVDPALIENIAQNLFVVVPPLKKKMFRLDIVQAEHGIPFSHIQVLSMLNESGSMSVSEISRKLGIAKPNITPLVDRLISKGLVDRVRDLSDRRVVNVVILPAGQEKLASIRQSIAEQVSSWTENLSVQDFKDLNDALETLAKILHTMDA